MDASIVQYPAEHGGITRHAWTDVPSYASRFGREKPVIHTGHTMVPDVTSERGAVRLSPSILRPLMDERAGLHVSHS